MKYDTKVALVTFGVFFVLVILSVTLIVVLTRQEKSGPAATSVTPSPPFVTPTPHVLRNVRLTNGAGLCYQFSSNLQPQLGPPEACTGFWIQNSSPDTADLDTLTYDGGVYEVCIQPPVVSGDFVLGTIGSGCEGVQLVGDTVQANNLCINNVGGTLTWGSCSSAYPFTVQSFS